MNGNVEKRGRCEVSEDLRENGNIEKIGKQKMEIGE